MIDWPLNYPMKVAAFYGQPRRATCELEYLSILSIRRLFRKAVQEGRSERRTEAYPWGTLRV